MVVNKSKRRIRFDKRFLSGRVSMLIPNLNSRSVDIDFLNVPELSLINSCFSAWATKREAVRSGSPARSLARSFIHAFIH